MVRGLLSGPHVLAPRRFGPALVIGWRVMLCAIAGMGCAAAAPSVVAATPAGHQPTVTLTHGSTREQATRRQLQRLFEQYDLSPWTFTPRLEIADHVVPHSHPVLTLSTRHLQDDLLLVATYIHEQSHWYFEARRDDTKAAMADLEVQFPGLPVGFPDGASDHDATYEHLCVIALEYDALIRLVGELRARQVMEFWATDHYRVLYRTVLDHDDALREVMKHHHLAPSR